MSGPRKFPPLAALLGLTLSAIGLGCDATIPLAPAVSSVTAGTVTLWAITGTALANPSAYSVSGQQVVRTDRSSGFDFAFDIQVDTARDTIGVFLPRGTLGLYTSGGLQVTTQAYDSITTAPTTGYQDTLPVTVKVGTVVLAASIEQTCPNGQVEPYYAKLQIDTLDLVNRKVVFAITSDPNCGYRSLVVDSLPPTH